MLMTVVHLESVVLLQRILYSWLVLHTIETISEHIKTGILEDNPTIMSQQQTVEALNEGQLPIWQAVNDFAISLCSPGSNISLKKTVSTPISAFFQYSPLIPKAVLDKALFVSYQNTVLVQHCYNIALFIFRKYVHSASRQKPTILQLNLYDKVHVLKMHLDFKLVDLLEQGFLGIMYSFQCQYPIGTGLIKHLLLLLRAFFGQSHTP